MYFSFIDTYIFNLLRLSIYIPVEYYHVIQKSKCLFQMQKKIIDHLN